MSRCGPSGTQPRFCPRDSGQFSFSGLLRTWISSRSQKQRDSRRTPSMYICSGRYGQFGSAWGTTMNSHLSEDQMSRSFIGRSTIQEEQHLQSCAQCQAELDGLRRTCSLFRDAMKDLANHRMAAGTLPKAATFVTPRRFVPVPWQLALVSAAVLLFAILPLYWNQDFQPSQPQFGETAAGWTET